MAGAGSSVWRRFPRSVNRSIFPPGQGLARFAKYGPFIPNPCQGSPEKVLGTCFRTACLDQDPAGLPYPGSIRRGAIRANFRIQVPGKEPLRPLGCRLKLWAF